MYVHFMESLLAGNRTSHPINSSSKYSVATWSRTSPQRMGYIESTENWCWAFQSQHETLGAAPISSLYLWTHRPDRTPCNPQLPHPQPTRKHYHKSDQPQPRYSELAATPEPNCIADSYARRSLLQGSYDPVKFHRFSQTFLDQLI